jgi:hypothetical protein
MKAVHPEISKIATVSAMIFLIGFSLSLLAYGASYKTILTSAGKTGVLLTLIGSYWTFFNKIGWKNRFFSLWGWLSSAPDLNGRWEGTICRNRNDEPHPFVIEISQTYSSLTYRTFSLHSRGESIVAQLFVNEEGTVFSLAATWRTTTRRVDDPSAEDSFEGASIWHLSLDSYTKIIEDHYYTRREPQTKGVVTVRWISADRLNRFQ